MFCEKCGAEIADGVMFCNACGNPVKKSVETSEGNYQFEGNANAAVMTENDEFIMPAEDTQLNGTSNAPKKLDKKIIIGGIVGLVAVIGILAWCLWDNVFFALAPEKYVGNLLDNTVDDMLADIEDITDNIFGVKMGYDDAFTVASKVELSSDNKSGINMTIDAKAANNPSNKELLYDAKVSGEMGGEKASIEAQAFLNDEKIAVAVDASGDALKEEIPSKIKGKYLSVPSKTFGDSFVKSDIGKEFAKEFSVDLSGLDLSYSNLTGDKKEELEPFRDAVKDEFLTLLENSEISDRKSVDYRFGDDEVSANKIKITFELEDVADFCVGVIDAAEDDDYLKKTFGDDTLARLDDLKDEINDERDSLKDIEVEIELIEYDGRIVEINCVNDGDGIVLKSTNKKHLLNGITMEVVSNNETISEVVYEANWADEDDEITVEGKVVANGNTMAKFEAELNFDSEKFKVRATANGTELFKVTGKCSKKDGFSLSVDGFEFDDYTYKETYSQEYDEWFADEYIDSGRYDYEYYYRNDAYSELYRIYLRDPDYYDYEEWYDDMGSIYDEDFVPYEDWITDKYYDDDSVLRQYDWECLSTERVDYKVKVKASLSIKDSVDFGVKKRNYINLFDLSMDELEDLFA